MRPLRLLVLATLCIGTLTACRTGITGPTLDDEGLRVLFIGNSLTYTHDVPGLVAALARRSGQAMSHASITAPDYSLEDHWNSGVANDIRRLRPDMVVMQQGPSSLWESRQHLVQWTATFAEVIREAGGEPALYMVWPSSDRLHAFDAVVESYTAAAEAVEGMLLPAGATWLAAWQIEPTLALYGSDGFHPGYVGALAAAMAIHAVLFDANPADIPALDDNLTAATRAVLRDAVAASIER